MEKELNELNFKKILILDDSIDIENYNINVYFENNSQHKIKGFCHECENLSIAEDADYHKYIDKKTEQVFQLSNISHGATAKDLLGAINNKDGIDFNSWHNESILFLMEGPSKDYKIYEEINFNGYKKRPSKQWYWIHKRQEKLEYPDAFKGDEYSALFNSIIFTFKLKNAYLTNLVKCGLNDSNDGYKGIDYYHEKCLNTCFQKIFLKEVEIVRPKLIFCFGSKVFSKLNKKIKESNISILKDVLIFNLPHPARGQGGFSHNLFRHSYFSMILEGLYKSGIYSLEEAKNKYSDFLTHSTL